MRAMRALALTCLLFCSTTALAASVTDQAKALSAIESGTRPEVDLAVSRLKNLGAPRDLLRSVAQMLGSPNPRTRENAAYVFSVVPDLAFAEPVSRATRDESEIVRQSACTALGRMKARQAVPALLPLLRDPSPVVRREAAKALGKIGDRSAAPKVAALLDESNAETRLAAILALGELKDRASEGRLVSLLKETSETVRVAAAKSLCLLGNAQGRKVLEGMLQSKDPGEQRDAIKLLEDLDLPWVREGLFGKLKAPELVVAIPAARALAGFGDGRGVEWLVHSAARVGPSWQLKIETALEDLRLTPADRKKILASKPSPGLVLPTPEQPSEP
jgi:HEAT repeat protein